MLSYGILGLVLDLECLLEHGNFQKFSQYFLSKFSFDKLSWFFEFCLRKFFEVSIFKQTSEIQDKAQYSV